GALAMLCTNAVVGQILAHRIRSDAPDNLTLAAIGTTRRQIVASALVPSALVAVCSAVVAFVVSTALSPLTPIGLARGAEPHPGVTFNVAVSAAALTVLVGATVLWALAAASAA